MKKNFIGMAGAIIFLVGSFMPLFTAEEKNNNYEMEVSYTVWGYKGSVNIVHQDITVDFSAGYSGDVNFEMADEKIKELNLDTVINHIAEAEGIDKKVLEFINILAYTMLILGSLLIIVAFLNNKALNIIFMILSVIGIAGISFLMFVVNSRETEMGFELAIGCGCFIMLAGLLLYLFSPKKKYR